MTQASLFATAYGAVFLAEVAGDKLLYTTGVLATRYRPGSVMSGAALAFGVKMAVAVALGSSIANLPPWVAAAFSALTFFSVAYWIGRDSEQDREVDLAASGSPFKDGAAAFAAIFFSEWGDIGQVTAAAMAVQWEAPAVVWCAAVAAMLTKAMIAASAGAWIRARIARYIQPAMLRYASVVLLMALGILSIANR